MNNWIDVANVTPISALIGGALIGLSAVVLILGVGHILGMSGIGSSALQQIIALPQTLRQITIHKKFTLSWQIVFIFGMALTTWMYALIIGFPEFSMNQPLWKTVLAGLLVGFGTRLGSGCTSGHGVCGISRLSGRSIVATLIFMTTGILTASLFAL